MKTVFIYALIDPRSNKIRYIGWAKNLRRRFRDHIKRSRTFEEDIHKARWIRVLLSLGLVPEIKVLEVVRESLYAVAERRWIKRISRRHLTNHTIGGDGVVGYHHTPERIEKYASQLRGRPKSLQHRMSLSAAKIGLKPSEETKRKMSKAHLGKKMPRSAVIKTATAHRGMKRSEVTKQKMRDLWKRRLVSKQIYVFGKNGKPILKRCSRCKALLPLRKFHRGATIWKTESACRKCVCARRRVEYSRKSEVTRNAD